MTVSSTSYHKEKHTREKKRQRSLQTRSRGSNSVYAISQNKVGSGGSKTDPWPFPWTTNVTACQVSFETTQLHLCRVQTAQCLCCIHAHFTDSLRHQVLRMNPYNGHTLLRFDAGLGAKNGTCVFCGSPHRTHVAARSCEPHQPGLEDHGKACFFFVATRSG